MILRTRRSVALHCYAWSSEIAQSSDTVHRCQSRRTLRTWGQLRFGIWLYLASFWSCLHGWSASHAYPCFWPFLFCYQGVSATTLAVSQGLSSARSCECSTRRWRLAFQESCSSRLGTTGLCLRWRSNGHWSALSIVGSSCYQWLQSRRLAWTFVKRLSLWLWGRILDQTLRRNPDLPSHFPPRRSLSLVLRRSIKAMQ